MEFLEISKNRKFEINKPSIAETYKARIGGFIEKKQLSTFLLNETDYSEPKVALGFCRAKDVYSLKSQNTFYFHAIEANAHIVDFPTGISEAKRLYIYSGGRRSEHVQLTGYTAEIKSIQLKHKSSIKGKEQSKTEYYYEVVLKDNFVMEEGWTFEIDLAKLFESDEKSRKQFYKFIPVMIDFDKLQKSRKE